MNTKHLSLTCLICLAGIIFNSCGNNSSNKPNQQTEIETTTGKSNGNEQTTVGGSKGTFDINSIPISNVELGGIPYLSEPKGYEYSDNKHERKYEEKLFFYNDSLVMTIGGKYYHTTIIPKRGEEFSETYLVKNYEEAIRKIGGVEIYLGRMNDKAREELSKNEMSYTKDMYDISPYKYKQFVVRTSNFNIWFELCYGLNIPAVDFTVICEGDMKGTITVIKADDLKKEIDKNGKAVLYVNFDTDKSTLKSDGIDVVSEIAKLMSTNPDLKLSIEGHTDNVGSAEYNKKLSSDRAKAVVNKLVELNIKTNRLKHVGYGAEKPLVANDSDENRAKNRRVEIVKTN